MVKTIEEMMEEDKGVGLEKYDPKEEGSGLMFVKLLHPLSKEVTDNDMKPGILINSRTKQKLADLEEDFKFIPLYYFKEYAILNEETNMPIKRSQKRSSFTEKELAWTKKIVKGKEVNIPPLAGEFLNFVIVQENVLDAPMILTFKKSDVKTGQLFRQKIQDIMDQESMPMYGMVYSTRVVKKTDGKRNWFGFDKVKPDHKIVDPATYLTLREHNKEISKIDFGSLLLGPAEEVVSDVPMIEGVQEETDKF